MKPSPQMIQLALEFRLTQSSEAHNETVKKIFKEFKKKLKKINRNDTEIFNEIDNKLALDIELESIIQEGKTKEEVFKIYEKKLYQIFKEKLDIENFTYKKNKKKYKRLAQNFCEQINKDNEGNIENILNDAHFM